ncbi:egg cell-secreted protein 1.4-like [Cicer arietinum]|uniref:Egg cell-secreted protein 1.3-like n=1 Tax=Cicer arietinum TaxID=3827 RepID=A0A1S2YE40_CICAR|nr:egg cell-secreted protein 1.3-like [Cicer arietinum]
MAKAIILKLFVILSLSTMVMARPISSTTTLATRLFVGENNKCWETMFELQHCTGEIVLFFLNGETKLGSGCCNALLTIAHQCWPNMLTSLGLTPEEAELLRGYCDGIASVNKSLPPFVTVNALGPIMSND